MLGERPEAGWMELLVSTINLLVESGEDVAVDAEQQSRAGDVLGVGSVSHVDQTTRRDVNLVVGALRED